MGPCEEYITCCIAANADLEPLLSDYTEESQFYLLPLAWKTLTDLDLIKATPIVELTPRGERLLGSQYPKPLLYWLQKWREAPTPIALVMISLAVHGIRLRGPAVAADWISEGILEQWKKATPNAQDARVALLAGAPRILRYEEAAPHFTHRRLRGILFMGPFWKGLGCPAEPWEV